MDRNYFSGKDSEFYSSSNQNKDSDDNQTPSELNLRNKLNNAFSDLENLRKALKDIRSNNDSMIGGNAGNHKNKSNQKFDFFSDDRYNNVLNQIKQSNQDKNKHSKMTSSSREKLAANNSYSIYKMQKENNREEKSIFIFYFLLKIKYHTFLFPMLSLAKEKIQLILQIKS